LTGLIQLLLNTQLGNERDWGTLGLSIPWYTFGGLLVEVVAASRSLVLGISIVMAGK
jgi:hypothetical protein